MGQRQVTGELDSGRRRAGLSLLEAHDRSIWAVARRFSLCADDADDAWQRAVVILLTKAPSLEPARLLAWMRVVTRNEALAVRRARERLLAGGGDAATLAVESEAPTAAEVVERRERDLASLSRLAALKPDERRAILLQASGYSYTEIGELTGWTYTKVNRCLAEGRARLRSALPAGG